jgi:hypothetical protein
VAASLLAVAVATLVSISLILNCGVASLVERESMKGLLQLANERGYSQSPVFGLQRGDRTLEFYAAGRVAYEADGEATMYDGVAQVVGESRKRQATILTVVPVPDVKQFSQLSSVRVKVIGDNGRFALVAVGP